MAVALSMVMLRQAVAPPAARIQQELRTRYPDLATAITSDEDGTVALKLRDGALFVALVRAPIPWPDLEGALRHESAVEERSRVV
jgi:hypothetical protein